MSLSFFPREYYASLYDIDFDRLYAKGIRGLLFDIDNTLAPYDVSYPDMKTVDFLNYLRYKGFNICLISNNGKKRVEKFCEPLNVKFVWKASKPATFGIKKAMGLIGAKNGQTALIGDQVFTDVLCANLSDIYGILIKPISDRDELTVRLKRGLERVVLKLYFRSRKYKRFIDAKQRNKA